MALSVTSPIRHDVEVSLRSDGTKAVIEGKTVVPFKTFVMLVIQRKVTALFKDWGTAPVVIDAELLTSLAGAPQDNQENKVNLVLVTLGIGVIMGVLAFAVLQFALLTINISMGQQELAYSREALWAWGSSAGCLGRCRYGEEARECWIVWKGRRRCSLRNRKRFSAFEL